MRDGYEREIEYLRISITDKCNLRCRYCMPAGVDSLPMSEILTYEEIVSVVKAAAKLGIKKLKITGGEPLVRRGCCELIKMLRKIPGIENVTITTNGVLLRERISELTEAGIDGINISIDTLDRERYRFITGRDEIEAVLEGLSASIKSGVRTRINAVSVDWSSILKCGDPYRDIFDLIDLVMENDLDVKFIEMMPIGFGKGFPSIPHEVLIPVIQSRYKNMTRSEAHPGSGPAVYYNIPGYRGRIGFISAMHGIFCDGCNRIRLTTQGYIKSCLCYDTGVDLKSIIRRDIPEDEKQAALCSYIKKAILCKPKAHSFKSAEKISEKHAMSEIGG